MQQRAKNYLKFFNDLELLKSVLRHSWLSSGRQESVAEHSWRLAMMALALEDEFPEINISHTIKIALVHDIGEVYLEGFDDPAFHAQPGNKIEKEQEALQKLVEPLSENNKEKIIALCKEYNECQTPEAKLAKALDKLEALIQHHEADVSTWHPDEFEYNLVHGKKYMDFHEFIVEFRKVIDDMTAQKMKYKHS